MIVNSGLAAIWAAAGFGYLWPVWPLIGWGMVIAGHAWAVHLLQDGRERLTPVGADAGAGLPDMKDDKRPSTLPRAPGEVAEWLKALAC